jgi:tetratricopeptide (TPR) repeat protein
MALTLPRLSRLVAPLVLFAALASVLALVNGGDEGVGSAAAVDPHVVGDDGVAGATRGDALAAGAPGAADSDPLAGGARADALAAADASATGADGLADFQRAVRAAPASAIVYAGLGEAYLVRARENGDPGLYSRAQRAFDAALRRDPAELGAVIGAGSLAGLRHDFAEQLRLGRRAVALAPGLARPYTVVADAQIELGRYGAAASTIQRIIDIKPSLAGYARASYYRELSGDLAGAVSAMRLAVSAGGSPESAAYVRVLLGDLELQRGRVEAARLAYASALRTLPEYPAGLVGLARADAAGGSLEAAAARLRRAAARLPLPRTLTLLAEVEGALSNERAAGAALAAARAQQALVSGGGASGREASRSGAQPSSRSGAQSSSRSGAQSSSRSGAAGSASRTAVLPDAEAVLFAADHGSPAAAVRLGWRVWRAAPSVRSADALGWALTRAGRPRAGYAFARRALRLGSRDPLFRLHAGIAAREAGLALPAARHLAVAAAGRAALSPGALDLLQGARR